MNPPMSPTAKALAREIAKATSPTAKLSLVYSYAAKVSTHPNATKDDVITILNAAVTAMQGVIVMTKRPEDPSLLQALTKKGVGLFLGGVVDVATTATKTAIHGWMYGTPVPVGTVKPGHHKAGHGPNRPKKSGPKKTAKKAAAEDPAKKRR